MIFQSFILGNLVSLCMKILNSVVVVGLYYGFLTTFSMGPSYLFLLRTWVMEEVTEKKVSATTGFITGQLMMFISIYYAPLHLALGRPHTITVLAVPYLLFHFFWNNNEDFLDYGSPNRNSMRNLRIQFAFLNNLIFQLFNHFIFPSSMLVRLVNIYMFRCNNKMLFVTSSFVGWLIGHILFMKLFMEWVDWLYVWIHKKTSITSNVLFRSNKFRSNKYLKYLVSELQSLVSELKYFLLDMDGIFSILFFITCVYSLGRAPSPLFGTKLEQTSETEETDVETTFETEEQEQEGSTEEDPFSSLFSEEKEDPYKIDETEEIQVNGKQKTKDEFHFHFQETCSKNRPLSETFSLDGNQKNSKFEILIEKKKKNRLWVERPFVTILFDYKHWNRPLRYKKNEHFGNPLKNEMGQYFFSTCLSDGKERLSFTYPPSLSTFLELIKRKISLFLTQKISSDELYNHWNSTNEQIYIYRSNEFIKRVQTLDKGYLASKTLEKRTRLCNHKTKKEYLPQTYDPLLSGPYRGKKQFFFLSSLLNKTFRTNFNFKERFWINKIHLILLITNYGEFEGKIALFNSINSKQQSFSRKIAYFLTLINEFGGKSRLSFNFKELCFFQLLFDTVLTNPKKKTSRKNSTGLKEIGKKVPRWSYRLFDDIERQDHPELMMYEAEILSRRAELILIFSDKKMAFATKDNIPYYTNTEINLIRYLEVPDFFRHLVKGSVRAQRRKTTIYGLYQIKAHSPIFSDRLTKSLFSYFSFYIFELTKELMERLMKTMFLNWMCKNKEFKIFDSTYRPYRNKKIKENDKIPKNEIVIKEEKEELERQIEQEQKDIEKELEREEVNRQVEIAEDWDAYYFGQPLRSSLLVAQSILRKYIIIPSLIITKNIIRILLFQSPEWSKDFRDWRRETHVKCTFNGIQFSDKEFPPNWFIGGLQIQILYPFRLKPWHRSKSSKDRKKKKVEKEDSCFLTIVGLETDIPFGFPKLEFSILKPILKQLEIRKIIKNFFRVLTILKEKRKKLSKSKRNENVLSEFREVDELNKNKKDSTINNNNWTVSELSIPIGSIPYTNYSLIERKMTYVSARRKIILNEIEKITNENKTSEVTISSNAKKLNSLNKISYIFNILIIKTARLVHKFDFFIKILIENIYIEVFLGIINIPRLNAHPFLESIKKIITKYIANNESNQKKFDKPNQNKFNFISIIKTSRDIADINKKSRLFCNISFLSQAYVFYKLSQTKSLNLYKLRSIFEYQNLFLKTEIKNYFRAEGLFNSELKEKNLINSLSLMNQWKNWLRSHYQYKYDLSQVRWSRLIPENCKNKIYQHHMVEKKKLSKWNLHEQDQLIHYEKTNYFYFELNLFANQKNNFKKHARYSLLSYESINYEKKTDFLIYESRTNKETIVYRKYFDWRLINFCLQKKVDIESWIDTCIKDKKKTKTRTKNYQIIDKIDKKSIYIYQDQEINSSKKPPFFFDWMGMNEEIQTSVISNSNFELWFFRKFVILYNTYNRKPWKIPIQFLLLNLKKNSSTNKKIYENKKSDLLLSILSNEKKIFELENQNHNETDIDETDIDEDSMGLGMTKRRNKKQNESNTETEVDFDYFLKEYLNLQFKGDPFNDIDEELLHDIKKYCFLIKMRNARETIISYIRRRELNMNLLLVQKNVSTPGFAKRGVLFVEPIVVSIKTDGKFLLYQMVGILLVHKNKEQINKKSREKFYVDENKKNFTDERRHNRIGNREKTYYDLLVPENILSPKHRRELRIRISCNFKNKNDIHRNTEIFNGNNIKKGSPALAKNKYFSREKNNLIKLKFFLWPNFRLEDLACMNRYWFDTNNGSRFSMVRIYIYPRLKF
uniref:Protein TIC 214 n=1 Tax=Euphorbia hirta TaxID=318062 RepID=A0A8K1VNI1_9ROSI|nr:Ycf1 protein [Euphorbia hirta]